MNGKLMFYSTQGLSSAVMSGFFLLGQVAINIIAIALLSEVDIADTLLGVEAKVKNIF